MFRHFYLLLFLFGSLKSWAQSNEQTYFNLTQSTCIWNAWDAAADNYPFMVMTASMLDKPLFEGKMRKMFATETRLTSRVGRLPDTYSFCKKGFENAVIDSKLVFGSAEYMKDGRSASNSNLNKRFRCGVSVDELLKEFKVASVEAQHL